MCCDVALASPSFKQQKVPNSQGALAADCSRFQLTLLALRNRCVPIASLYTFLARPSPVADENEAALAPNDGFSPVRHFPISEIGHPQACIRSIVHVSVSHGESTAFRCLTHTTPETEATNEESF